MVDLSKLYITVPFTESFTDAADAPGLHSGSSKHYCTVYNNNQAVDITLGGFTHYLDYAERIIYRNSFIYQAAAANVGWNLFGKNSNEYVSGSYVSIKLYSGSTTYSDDVARNSDGGYLFDINGNTFTYTAPDFSTFITVNEGDRVYADVTLKVSGSSVSDEAPQATVDNLEIFQGIDELVIGGSFTAASISTLVGDIKADGDLYTNFDGPASAEGRVYFYADTGGGPSPTAAYMGWNNSITSLVLSTHTFVAGNLEVQNDLTVNVDSSVLGTSKANKFITDNANASQAEFKSSNSTRTDVRILNTSTGDAVIFFDAANGDLAGGDYASIGQLSADLNFLFHLEASAGSFTMDKGLQIGDVGVGATNYIEIQDDGTLRLNGTAQVWDDIRVPVTSTKKGSAKPPTESVFKTTLLLEWFSPSQEQELFFTVQIPHNYKENSNIYPHVHWTPSNTDTGQVDWFLTYTWANTTDTFPAEATVTMSDDGSGTVGDHQRSANVTLAGAGKEISSMLVCRIWRDGGQGTDAFTGSAGLLEIDFHYEIDSLGSDSEFIK